MESQLPDFRAPVKNVSGRAAARQIERQLKRALMSRRDGAREGTGKVGQGASNVLDIDN